MTDDNYMEAIEQAQNLLNELLNDPNHGALMFEGMNGLDNLIITGPNELDALTSGTVLSICREEWMALSTAGYRGARWQHFTAGSRVTSERLYLNALDNESDLAFCHEGL